MDSTIVTGAVMMNRNVGQKQFDRLLAQIASSTVSCPFG
jgi:hypothetical protein